MIVDCIVCGVPLETEYAHTFHDTGCPQRTDPDGVDECVQWSTCGADCHAYCCPTCNPPQEDE